MTTDDPPFISHRFQRTEILRFPKERVTKNEEDANYWRNLQFPISIQESAPVQRIDVAQCQPHFLAITGTSKVQIYDPDTNDVCKTFTKFKEGSYGARFRRDAKLLCAGTGENSIKLFDLETKTQLRQFRGHTQPAKRVDFMVDNKAICSFSDDRTVRLWDIATEEQIARHEEHKDYVRCGSASAFSSDILVSGSYDHTVKVWDRRKNESVLTLEHGAPVEDVLMLPNDALLISSGGHDVKVWDLLAGGKLLFKLSPHTKTITSLGFANGHKRLVTASLDCHMKFHDLTNFVTVYSMKFPAPVLTAAVAPDDSLVAAGMSDGLVQFRHRKKSDSKEAQLMKETKFKYLQFTDFQPKRGDLVITQDKREKEAKHDTHLRKFEHSKALDAVLKPYVQHKHPDYTYSVLKELKRRGALVKALAGRDEKNLSSLMTYINRYISDARYSDLLIQVADEILNLYGESLGNQPNTDKLFRTLRRKVERESRNLRQLLMLKGSLDLILAASKSHLKPELRTEEVRMNKLIREEKVQYPKLNMSLDKVLLAE